METERLILRAWKETDAESLYKYAKDPLVGPIAGWPPHTSVENSREIIRDILSAPETYAVVLKETNEAIGSVGIMFSDGLYSADVQEGDAEIGYWIGVPYWGKGLIPEAVKLLLRRCFEELNIKRVWAGHYDGNTKSRRVMEKCGFKYHHTEENKVSPLGDIRTEHFTLITKDEWEIFIKNDNMKILKIDNTEHCSFKAFAELYKTSFPIFEQRTEIQQKYAFSNGHYNLNGYYDNDDFIGFISYWEFDSYIYIEHFAINTDIRGKGYGSSVLNSFINSTKKIVLLEIDPVVDDISAARLRFYKRCGFFENSFQHKHPAYRNGFNPHSLIVLTTKRGISENEYNIFNKDLNDIVMK